MRLRSALLYARTHQRLRDHDHNIDHPRPARCPDLAAVPYLRHAQCEQVQCAVYGYLARGDAGFQRGSKPVYKGEEA